ncbi:MAG TPA: FAD-dependent oxidoreductase, partial [Candidatus Acidoferrales bacterium]|nr:FAD-dependent oxidoreductase [Candidatus Acidoferrales bacterium]
GLLPETLAEGIHVCLRTPVEAIDVSGNGVSIRVPGGTICADHVVLATTANIARDLYAPTSDVEERLLATGYSSTVNVGLILWDRLPTDRIASDIYGVLIPRKERAVVAGIGIESRKCPDYVPRGEILNVMLDGNAGNRLVHASEDAILAEVLLDLDRYFPHVEKYISSARFHRWPIAEPLSPVGRSRDICEYRAQCRADQKVILAGDYVSAPTTEGAVESGLWAAQILAGAISAMPCGVQLGYGL